MVIPDPGEADLIVRATHVEAPAVDVYEDVDGQRSFVVPAEEADEFTPVEPAEFGDFVDLGRIPRAADAGDGRDRLPGGGREGLDGTVAWARSATSTRAS